jgi:hypothetical protein
MAPDAVFDYDPFGASYAFSPIGFQGITCGGGNTQNCRHSTSLKYRINIDHFGAAALSGRTQAAPVKIQFNGVAGFRTYIGARRISLESPAQAQERGNDRRSVPSNQRIGETGKCTRKENTDAADRYP